MRIIKKLFRKSFFLILIFNLIFSQSHVIGASNKKLPSGLKYEDLPRAIENYVNENKEQCKFFITTLLAITQFMVIIIFEMYKFWRI